MNRFALMLLIATASCKGKPTTQDPPPNTAKGSSAATNGSGSGSSFTVQPGAGSATNDDIWLPPSTKTAPNKSPKITPEKVKALSVLEFQTWKREVRSDGVTMETLYTTKSRPFIRLSVLLGPCFDCIPMDLEKWKAKESALKQIFPKGLEGQPGTIFEPGTYSQGDQPMIYTYQLGQTSKKDENDNPSSVYAHAYALYFNDGTNMIRVTAEYKDMPMANVESLGQVVKRDLLELIAKAFMDKFTHEW